MSNETMDLFPSKTKRVISSSFGKDSMAQILLAHIHNEPIDEIVFVSVMFDEITSAEAPEHIEFVHNKAIPFCESIGMPVKYKQLYIENKDKLIRTNINWNFTMEDLIREVE